MVGKWDAPGIHYDEVGAALDGAHDLIADDRMRLGCVRPGDEDTICIPNFFDRVCHGSASEGLHEACNCGAVSETGAMVYVIRADAGAEEFLEEVVLLVGAACRG
jgi:hypothetical protein